MQKQSDDLQRIDEYHTNYLGYQYPLLFPYGEDDYMPNVKHLERTSNTYLINIPLILKGRLKIFHGNKRQKETNLQKESG